MNDPEYANEPDAIVAAAWDGLPDLVQRLINSGADINIQDETGQTTLIAASDQGYFGIVELLLKQGADPNIKDKDGDSALDIAHYKGHDKIVKLLVAHGAEGKSGPSAKEQTCDQVYDSFERADAVKKLVSEIGKKKMKSILAEKRHRILCFAAICATALLISNCATQPYSSAYDPPGFFSGLLHGFLIVFSFIGSLLTDYRIYAFPNSGGWYDFGYLIGASMFLGGSGASAR